MAQKARIRRKQRRVRPQLRRAPAPAMRAEGRKAAAPESGLMVGGVQDAAERRADRTADRVMRMAAPVLHRKCDSCAAEEKEKKPGQEDEKVRTKTAGHAAPVAAGPASAPASHGAARAIGAMGSGRPLASAERAFFEPRFGADLSPVRIHDGRQGDRASKSVNARAFALGDDIAFARGEYAPGTSSGRRLMAHELAHVMEDGGVRRKLRRTGGAPAKADPLCNKYDPAFQRLFAEIDIDALARRDNADVRLSLIQSLKMIHRCGDAAEKTQIHDYMKTTLGEERAASIWKESLSALGGYRGVYPGYYAGKSWLTRLGMTEVEAFDAFRYNPRSDPGETLEKGAEASASAMAATLEHTDILYFYGHQYAQYGRPGAFANGSQTQFIDLGTLAAKGDFSSVKLIVSTSCATLCKEAIEVFAPLFPNAVILGYRKSAPIEGGAVRQAFDKAITGLKKPLLLDQPVDIAAIAEVWKSVVAGIHGKEDKRLPGYYQNGTVHYLENGIWASLPGTDPANTCRKKGTAIEQATH